MPDSAMGNGAFALSLTMSGGYRTKPVMYGTVRVFWEVQRYLPTNHQEHATYF